MGLDLWRTFDGFNHYRHAMYEQTSSIYLGKDLANFHGKIIADVAIFVKYFNWPWSYGSESSLQLFRCN
ncbi:predicted protein [Botrytis cinerea T4]|uniref:Uncharacterized protein n=1 Tax=Botryotinia fuckeliana (strain T4) TaxID=999810 RepID=G2XZJ6_BOTF4|nr:predicted protein [Botrytis cinerea T4]